MEKEKNQSPEKVTQEVIEYLLRYETPEYHHLKEIAEKDLGKELINRIEAFFLNPESMKSCPKSERLFSMMPPRWFRRI